jgi:hypothetical protein
MAALIAPLAGAGGTKDAFPMVALVLGLPVAALAARLLLTRTGSQPLVPAVAAAAVPAAEVTADAAR